MQVDAVTAARNAAGDIQIPRKKLGRQPDAPLVSVVSLGFMTAGGGITHWDHDKMKPSLDKTVEKYISMGGNLINTADVYGHPSGENEKILGEYIAKFGREKFFISTKIGLNFHNAESEEHREWGGPCLDPAYVKEAVNKCCERLGVDTIDLVILHRIDVKTEIEQTMEALLKLRDDEKKLKYVGVSEFPPDWIKKAHAVMPLTCIENEYSMAARDSDMTVVPIARELGIGFLAYSPLVRGLVTGHIRTRDDLHDEDWRLRGCGYFNNGKLEQNLELVDKIGDFAKSKGITAAQLALAWLLHLHTKEDVKEDPFNPDGPGTKLPPLDLVPIPCTTKPERLEENVMAAFVKLTDEEMATISSEILSSDFGPRYNLRGYTPSHKLGLEDEGGRRGSLREGMRQMKARTAFF